MGDKLKSTMNCNSYYQNELAQSIDGEINQIDLLLKYEEETTEEEQNIGHRRVSTDGAVYYKNINTSKIMRSIQLEVKNCMGDGPTKPSRDLLMADFMAVESTSFTSGDNTSILSQCSGTSEFIIKTYAPVAFSHFRDLFGITSDDFISSFCDEDLVELGNPGKSGSIFYLTRNDKFIAKTIQHKEALFLQKLLPGYYLNLSQNRYTLLPQFFGLYRYLRGTKNVRTLVMNNVLPSSIAIHNKYDLKGSTYKRKYSTTECPKSSPTFKDLDFINHYPEGIFLDADVYNTVIKALERDCRVLESFQIIDYSLLLGVHEIDPEKGESDDQFDEILKDETYCMVSSDKNINDNHKPGRVQDVEISATLKNKSFPTYNGSKNRDCKTERISVLKGFPAREASGKQLILFIGIIDILQSYRLKKKVEHFWKSIVHDGDSVSVHNPHFYAKRFLDFISTKVFKPILNVPKQQRRRSVLKLKHIDKICE